MPAKNTTHEDLTTLEAKRQQIDNELAELQLEEARDNRDRRRSLRDQRDRNRKSTESSLAEARANQEQIQAGCSHRKGGKYENGAAVGSSGNYAVIQHTLADGTTFVICQRCTKEWNQPDKKAIDPLTNEVLTTAAYTLLLKEYREALNFPTDNTPSGSRLFQVHKAA